MTTTHALALEILEEELRRLSDDLDHVRKVSAGYEASPEIPEQATPEEADAIRARYEESRSGWLRAVENVETNRANLEASIAVLRSAELSGSSS
jgi:hypothetical protein